MPKAIKGVLIECDPSIKAIIVEIDRSEGGYIVEDLDDQTLVIKEDRLAPLKARLEEKLASTQMQVDDDSESD